MTEVRLSLEMRIQVVKIYYETKNVFETIRWMKQLFPQWQGCDSKTISRTVKRFELRTLVQWLRLDGTFPGRWLGRKAVQLNGRRGRSWSHTRWFLSVGNREGHCLFSRKSNSMQELKGTIENALAHFVTDLCSKICQSVAARCTKCIAQNGGHFEHL